MQFVGTVYVEADVGAGNGYVAHKSLKRMIEPVNAGARSVRQNAGRLAAEISSESHTSTGSDAA